MSELKVIDVDKMADVRSLSGQFYLKSEADKEIQRLEKLCENYRCDCDNLAIMTDTMRKAGRTLRQKMNHQKYNRCLAMARWCESEEKRLEAIAPIFDTDKECWEHNSDYWDKWRNHWLELAEEPTWAKFLQLMHKETK